MHTLECRVAIETLLSYLEGIALPRGDADAAINHIRECPYCKRRVGHLVRALRTKEEDQLTCQQCQDLFPDYFQAEMAGQAGEVRWHSVALHLETCPHCAAEYAAFSDLTIPGFAGGGEEPPRYPNPDLSFLRMPWHLDNLGHLIIEFSAELLRAFQPPAYQPAYATGRHKSTQSRRILCQFSLKKAIEDLEVTITGEQRQENAVLCTIIVEVDIPSRGGWPNLAGTEVTIKRGDKKLATQSTDAFGKAVFKGVATKDLPHLVFEIAPSDPEM